MSSYYPTNPGFGAAATAAKRAMRGTVYRPGNPGVWGTAGSRLPKRIPPPTRTTAPAPTDPYANARASVEEIIAALLGDVQREQDEARKQAELEAGRKLAEGQALAYGLQQLGISQAVQAAFQNAGMNQAAIVQGFAGATRDAASAQAAEQIRQLSGTGQEGAVRNEGTAMGDVTYGLGGYIPATALNQTGAAFGAQAALQPGFAVQFGQLAKAERDRQWASELMGWADKKAEILAQKPKLMAEAIGDEQEQTKLQARQLSNGQIQWFDPYTGRAVGKPQGPPKARGGSSGKLTVKTLANGQIQWYDPLTGKAVGRPQGPPRTNDGANLQAKPYGDGRYIAWDPETGQTVGAPFGTRSLRRSRRSSRATTCNSRPSGSARRGLTPAPASGLGSGCRSRQAAPGRARRRPHGSTRVAGSTIARTV